MITPRMVFSFFKGRALSGSRYAFRYLYCNGLRARGERNQRGLFFISQLQNIVSLAISSIGSQRLDTPDTLRLLSCLVLKSTKKASHYAHHRQCLHLHLRTHIGIPSLHELPSSESDRARLIESGIYQLTCDSTTWRLFLDSLSVIELSGLWPDYERLVFQRLLSLSGTPKEAWRIACEAFSELCRLGHYEVGERLLITLKQAIHPSTLDGSLYLSAVGHTAQLWYLIQMREKTGTPRSVTIRRTSKALGNSMLARKILEQADYPEWKVIDAGAPDFSGEHFPDMELFPSDGDHLVVRRTLGEVMHKTRNERPPKFLVLTDEEVHSAIGVIRGLGHEIRVGDSLIGVHVRTGSDPLSGGRDSSPAKYVRLINFIVSLGYRVALIGTEQQAKFFRAELPPTVINLTARKSPERELVHNFVWAHSTFVIGNLSGGTEPAVAYGTPVLWTDFFPLRHYRPYSSSDFILPKLVVDESGRFQSFDRVMRPGSTRLDSESLPLLLSHGFAVQEVDYTSLKDGFLDMHNKVQGSTPKNSVGEKEETVNKYYEELELGFGATWAPSFIARFADLIR